MRPLLGAVLVVFGAAMTITAAGRGGAYRVGPWPGLSMRGAAVLLGCAALLGGVDVLLGPLHAAVPDLALATVGVCAPMLLATRVVYAPGAASAACGAYLMPRSLLSLVDGSVELPPLWLVGALCFDVALWLRRDDLAWLRGRVRPGRRVRLGRRVRARTRTPGRSRAALAGAVFAVAMAAVQPPFAVLLDGVVARWSAADVLSAAALAMVACSALAAAIVRKP